MFNRAHKNDDIDLQHDVNELTDSLEALLKTLASGAQDESQKARANAGKLLQQTKSRLPGNSLARDASIKVGAYVKEKPWQVAGIGAAVGIVLGALLISRR
ncbi:DUF883 family protein [[Erwinia] mediterraneensis]|uniref:DUF883 family protein n=1 Tax=[Erwinia] mediterraneensis TaxID=2161819 RepID=UPI001031CE76|nr:DUF883 family protein [[Erwinia] mediterraneensis]